MKLWICERAKVAFQKLLKRLARNDLIILDDFGLVAMNADTRIALLQILEDRYEKKSVIIASQLPINKWYDYIAEATLADAIMDRLVNSSNIIQLDGPSMRYSGTDSPILSLKGREFEKKVLTLPTILKITNGVNGYHRN